MKRTFFISVLFTLVFGCASQANLEFNLDTWKGHNVNGLIEHWGTPSNVNNSSSGIAQYTWLFDKGIANSAIDGAVRQIVIYCKVTIDVATDETIESWTLEGNDCKV